MGWVRGIATVFGPVLLARKRSAVIHRMKWMEFGLFICTIIPAVNLFGIVGAALVLLAVYILSLILHVLAVRRELSGGMREIVTGIGYGTVPGVVAFICAMATAYLLPDKRLLLIGILFLAVWGVLLWLRERVFMRQLLQMAGKR